MHRLLICSASILVAAAPAAAQPAARPVGEAAAPGPLSEAVTLPRLDLPPLPSAPPLGGSVHPMAPVPARAGAAIPHQENATRSRLTRLLTGAAIGGWLGYFASQVAVSDWDNSSQVTMRGGWAAAGMVAGAVTGLMTLRGRPGGVPGAMRPVAAASARGAIEREEIARSGAANAYELVRSIRKEWLMPRGVNSFRESARGYASLEDGMSVTPGADHILVYLNSARLGGTQHLEEVSLAMVERIEFIDAAQATFRWGTGHAHGVILLTSVPPAPER